jgi:quinoprotein dehydrogenase-associated probable ABC transporter substrate-binding protein
MKPVWAPNNFCGLGFRALAFLLAFAGPSTAQTRPELVATDRLRVCADPGDLPFSNKAKEGFENKIAEILADELKLPLHYYWQPQGPGFVRLTLGTGLCDLIMGYAVGADIVDHTNAYYASTYVLVTKKGGPLDGIDRLEDPRLKDHKLGVVAGTPPSDHFLRLGLAAGAKSYPLVVDRRYLSPAEDALEDVQTGVTDGAVLWGPIGGYFAKKAKMPLTVTPLREDTRPLFSFRIAFGIRHNEPEWKHRLNAAIRKRQDDIAAVLTSYGVPLTPIDSVPAEAPARKSPDGAE